MLSYPVSVAGKDEPGGGWVYTAHAAALIADPLTVGRDVLRLERGKAEPADTSHIAGRVALSTNEQMHDALAAARAAQPAWAQVPFERRLEVAEEVRLRLIDRADEFIDVLVAEGHPVALARWELSGVMASLHPRSVRMAADMWRTELEVSGRRVRYQYQPDGVVALSPPQNAAASNSLLGVWSLAAGNSLVVAAPRSCPLGVAFIYHEIVAPALAAAGAPDGVLSVLCTLTSRALTAWVDSPFVDDIFYCGSSQRGRKLAQACYAQDKKPVLELSGNDGVVVWSDADVVLAARALAEAFLGSGQICMLPRYAVIHPDVADELIANVVSHAEAMRPGLPDDPAVQLSPVFKAPQFRTTLRQFTDAGAKVLCGAQTLNLRGRPEPGGMFIQPTVVRVDGWQAAAAIPAIHEETFFPMLKVVVPQRDDDLLERIIAFVNANPYGLRNSLWAADRQVIERVTACVRNGGMLKVNDSHAGFVVAAPTHGGTGLTGGPHGGAAIPLMRTAHLQVVCDATHLGEPADLAQSVAAVKAGGISGQHRRAGGGWPVRDTAGCS